jgi:hypothetical protein
LTGGNVDSTLHWFTYDHRFDQAMILLSKYFENPIREASLVVENPAAEGETQRTAAGL